MRIILTTHAMLILLSFNALGQLTSIAPNSGIPNQFLTPTITSNNLFLQSGSASGNIYSINLYLGGTFAINLFDYWFTSSGTNVINSNTVTTELSIPSNAPVGVYSLSVVTGDVMFPWMNQFTYTLPNAFTVGPVDGYITGTVYFDLNKNGVKDVGEPGIINRSVKLLPLGLVIPTDANGDYTFAVANGSYQVAILNNTSDFLFSTGNDTIPVTINNSNSPGNNFGLKQALVSITPDTGYRGITQLHQIIADEPIFTTGVNPNGNVNGITIFSTPSFSVTPIQLQATVINSTTLHVNIPVPIGTQIGNNLNIRISTGPPFNGFHNMSGKFNVANPPNTVAGTVFFDMNQNKIYDAGDQPIENAKLTMVPDNSIAYTNSSGSYQFGTIGGVQTVSYANNISGLTLYTDSASFTFNASGSVTGKDFGLLSIFPDYTIHIAGPYIFARCNSDQILSFKVRNSSNITYNATVWMKYSSNMTFLSSTINPVAIVGDTIFWNITMPPWSTTTIGSTFSLPGAGSTISFHIQASSLDGGGVPQQTNTFIHTVPVFCAWDPNDKQVTPPGILAPNYTLITDTLEYLIRFQNTGNDTAFRVVILDTLNANLDISTFELLGSSHSMMTQVKANGAMRFTFDNINLPDSNVNEPASHGYIRYRILADSLIPDGTPVNNTAYIYFDFNPAVVTNTTLNTMVDTLPLGIPLHPEAIEAWIYPHPVSQQSILQFENKEKYPYRLEIFDVSGKSITMPIESSGNRFIIDRKTWTSGIYFYRLTNLNNHRFRTGKMVVE
jgi:uncharacterized repeat protein (TIGR01451 family)